MSQFISLDGIAAPLIRANIDTDIIIRVEPLFAGVSREDLGNHCFAAWRFQADGMEDPAFILNQTPYRAAGVLLAGVNFGCGSSREGAVWALLSRGIRCVIAPSFGDIFMNNCCQNGLLPVELSAEAISSIAADVAADPTNRLVRVDLAEQTVRSPNGDIFSFHIAALRRQALLTGLDAIELTLQRDDAIRAFQHADRERRPWIYSGLQNPIQSKEI